MSIFRSFVSTLAVASLLSAAAPSTSYARHGGGGGGGGGGGAALGIGLGLGLLGAALAARHAQQYYAPRRAYVYVPRRHYVRAPMAPLPEKVGSVQVRTDEPIVAHTFFNCAQPQSMSDITAHANHGFVKEGYSTRLDCGNTEQEVKEFTYLSPQGYQGDDTIVYTQHGRMVAKDLVHVGDFEKPIEPTRSVEINNSEEHQLLGYAGCTAPDMQVKADSGFAVIRESHEEDQSCGNGEKTMKRVLYRSAGGFKGVDHVTFYSSVHNPIVFDVSVNPGADHTAPAPQASQGNDNARHESQNAPPQQPSDPAVSKTSGDNGQDSSNH